MTILQTLANLVLSGLLALNMVVVDDIRPGAVLPKQDALIDTYLAENITNTQTTMTLADGTARDGTTLSGRYCFTIDINTPTLEYVCGTVSGTSVTGLERGVKVSDPTSTSSALAYSHRRFASVQVTDFPFNQFVQRLINGTDAFESAMTFDEILTYTSALSFTPGSNQLITALYADSIANQGAATSSETAAGIAELATQVEMASSTDLGANSPLMLQAKYATSSCQVSGLYTVITANNGKIDMTNCADLTQSLTWSGAHTWSATTTHATSSHDQIAIGSSTPSQNFTLINGDGDTYLTGGLGVGTGTTTNGDLAVSGNTLLSGNVEVSGTCDGCLPTHEIQTSTFNFDGATPAVASSSVSCTAGYKAVGGGYRISDALGAATAFSIRSYPLNDTTWGAKAYAPGGTSDAGTIYVICLKD